jgi:hypothetical protein
MMPRKITGMMAGHRNINEEDKMQMTNMCRVGITTPNILCSFASKFGGFENVGFHKQDTYNLIDKERRKEGIDASATLRYMRELAKNDPVFLCSHNR